MYATTYASHVSYTCPAHTAISRAFPFPLPPSPTGLRPLSSAAQVPSPFSPQPCLHQPSEPPGIHARARHHGHRRKGGHHGHRRKLVPTDHSTPLALLLLVPCALCRVPRASAALRACHCCAAACLRLGCGRCRVRRASGVGSAWPVAGARAWQRCVHGSQILPR